MTTDQDFPEKLSLDIHAEDVVVGKRRLPDRTIRVATTLVTRDVVVDVNLTRDDVTIERVPVGRYVETMPEIRIEGGVSIMPVVEEEVVVTRRLFLREEVHVRRTRVITNHVETVNLRQQDVVVTRDPAEPSPETTLSSTRPGAILEPRKETSMAEETIVAVYDTAAHADAAVADLKAANVPDSMISRHTGTTATSTAVAPPVREQGFWASLFGGETEHDGAVYDRSLDTGSSVVIVKGVQANEAEDFLSILERHSPIDIDERAAGYGLTGGHAMTDAATATGTVGGTAYSGTPVTQTGMTGDANTLQLSEEQIAVGKRLVNRGGTRIRRYVVETPVEENVTLHSERVTLERKPVTDGRPVTDGSFSDKVIEMTETAEEAVISKTARVVEEVSLHKEASDRVETVRDTVRKEEVKVEQLPGSTSTTTASPLTSPVTPAR